MTKFRVLALLAVLAVLLVLPGRTALAQQQPPHRFGGAATLDGKPVAAGTTVAAVIDGKTVATAITTAGGNYIIDVVQPDGASYAGKAVTFNIGAGKATQTATWSLGAATVLNLAAASGPPALTPQLTPTPTPVTTPPGPKQGLFGVVTAVTKDAVTLKKNGETVTLKVDAFTIKQATIKSQVSVPGIANAAVNDIPVGSRVAVLVERRADGPYIVRIMVMAAQANEKHITLTVLEVSGKTVIGVTSGGEQIVVELESELPGELKGQLITFIGEQPESNRFKAKAAMKLENVIARLDKHVKEKKGEAEREGNPQAKARKQQDVERLKTRLEANLEEHLNRFAEVIAKAPEQARPGLERALENFKKEAEASLRSIDRPTQDVKRVVERRTLKGTVESVNTAAGEVVVRSKGDAVIKVKAVATTQIRIGEAPGTIADIRTGDPIEVRFNQQTGEATSIHVKLGVEAKGKIKTISIPALDGSSKDATAKTLVLELPSNATLTLKLTERTQIEINDRSATVANLSVGMIVEVKYNSRTLELETIEGKLKSEFKLTVDRVDAQAGTIVGHTDDGKSITVKVTDSTRTEANGTLSSIFGLQTGARIEVEINPLTGEALKIEREDNEENQQEAKARGTVVKVDVATKKLTVRLPNKSEITVTIANATELEVDGRDAALTDFKVGDEVKLEYDPQTMVALEVQGQGEQGQQGQQGQRGQRGNNEPSQRQPSAWAKVEGTITAVDPAKGTLTIFTKNGETRVITIRSDTAMAFNDKRISALSELPVAAAVKVEHTEGNVAIRIEAKKRGPDTKIDKSEDKAREDKQKEQDASKASEDKRKEEAAAEAKRREGAAVEAKRREEAAAEAKRREEAAVEAKRREEAAAEAKRKEEAAAEAKRKEETAAEAKRREEAAAEAKRKEEAAAGGTEKR